MCATTAAWPGEHGHRGSQHQGPDDRLNPCSTCHRPKLQFNSIKHKRTRGTTASVTVGHTAEQETPVPTYIGMMLHSHARKRELVNKLSHLGMSISYDRVIRVSARTGNSVCQQFHREQVVYPPKMCGKVFITAAVDNSPCATTAKESFHGTAISFLQHPSFAGEGVDRNIVIVGGSGDASFKTVGYLPHYYTDVPPSPATSRSRLSQLQEWRH